MNTLPFWTSRRSHEPRHSIQQKTTVQTPQDGQPIETLKKINYEETLILHHDKQHPRPRPMEPRRRNLPIIPRWRLRRRASPPPPPPRRQRPPVDNEPRWNVPLVVQVDPDDSVVSDLSSVGSVLPTPKWPHLLAMPGLLLPTTTPPMTFRPHEEDPFDLPPCRYIFVLRDPTTAAARHGNRVARPECHSGNDGDNDDSSSACSTLTHTLAPRPTKTEPENQPTLEPSQSWDDSIPCDYSPVTVGDDDYF